MNHVDDALLTVRGLEVRFRTRQGTVHAVNGVDFSVQRGETLSIVGESGSGKTATVLALLRLLPPHQASARAEVMRFKGRDLPSLDDEALRRIRGNDIAMVFQDPQTSLNPVLTIGRQLTEVLEVHRGFTTAQAREAALKLLRSVGIPSPEDRLDDYPHEFSGGMCQRVTIAMALSCGPSLLIADEPTTALDVTIQAQILELMSDLRASSEMSLIWITHDLGVVAELADWVAVMYAGYIVEYARVDALFDTPQHPYTIGLMRSIPPIDPVDGAASRTLPAIPGQPPNLLASPPGCPFVDRCDYVFERCRTERPPLEDVASDQRVACWWDVGRSQERERA